MGCALQSRKVHEWYTGALIHEKVLKACSAVVKKEGTAPAGHKVITLKTKDIEREVKALKKRKDVLDHVVENGNASEDHAMRAAQINLEALEQEKEALESCIKHKCMEILDAEVEVEDLVEEVSAKLATIEGTVASTKLSAQQIAGAQISYMHR